jgi:AraC family transcriptional activator FtrA
MFEFACAHEVLRGPPPDLEMDWYELTIASETGRAVSTTDGLTVVVAAGLEAFTDAEMVVVPGWRQGPVPDAVASALRASHSRGARIVSICNGATALAAAGLLAARRASTHWRYAEQLKSEDPSVEVDVRSLYVDHGDVVTSAGAAAGLDMLLHLVRLDYGIEAANKVARGLVVPFHREGDQAQFIPRPVLAADDVRLARAIAFARNNLHRALRVAELADCAAMSVRTFHRSFSKTFGMNPQAWLSLERVSAAQSLLERADLGLAQVAEAVGFSGPDAMGLYFKRELGIAPGAYRRSFKDRDAGAAVVAE